MDDLTAAIEANRVPILATAGAAVVAFALLQRHKAGGNTAAPAAAAGGFSSGGQVAGIAPGYDSGANDAYNALQPQIEALANKLNTVPVTPRPPMASSLTAPTYSGNYVRFADGSIDEVESDGSLYWLTGSEHAKAFANNGGAWSPAAVDQLSANSPTTGVYSTQQNLLAKQAGWSATPPPATS